MIKDEDETYLQAFQKLEQLQDAWSKVEPDLLNTRLRDRFLQMLDREERAYILSADPATGPEAVKLVTNYRIGHPNQKRWPTWEPTDTSSHGRPFRERRPREGGPTGPFRERRPREEGPTGTKTTTPIPKDLEGMKVWKGDMALCYNCRQWGHVQRHCPQRKDTRECLVITSDRPDSPTNFDQYQGFINGKTTSNIAINSLCSLSQVHPKWIKEDTTRQGWSNIKGANKVVPRELVQVRIRVQGRTFMQLMAINPTLSFDAILGLDVPYVRALVRSEKEWPKNSPQEDEVDDRVIHEPKRLPRQCIPHHSYDEGPTEATIQAIEDEEDEGDGADEKGEEPNEERDATIDKSTEKSSTRAEEELPQQLDDSLFIQTPKETRPKQPRTRQRLPLSLQYGRPIALEGGREQLLQEQRKDSSLKECHDKATNERGNFSYTEEGILMRQWTATNKPMVQELVMPKPYREEILRKAHGSSLAAHMGRKKTQQRILKNYFWLGLSTDVKEVIQQCHVCQMTGHRNIPKHPMMPLPIMEVPFKRIAADIVGPLPATAEGHRYILTTMDYGTKYPEAVPMKEITAQAVADELVQMFCRVGVPEEIITDRGSNFCAELSEALFRLLGIDHVKTSAYHPQTDGMVERFNGTMMKALKRWTKTQGQEWNKGLPFIMFAYREVPHSSTGYTPFELMYGRDIRGPLDVLRQKWQEPEDKNNSTVSYLQEVYRFLETARNNAHDMEDAAKEKAK